MSENKAKRSVGGIDGQAALTLLALIVLTCALFGQTWADYYQGWHAEENQQGWLVLPLFAFILWMKWPHVVGTPVRGNRKGGMLVLGAAMLLQIGGAWLGLHRSVGYSFVIAVIGFSLYYLGTAWTYKLAFPLAFLFFMVPLPGGLIDEISSPLQRFSASAVQSVSGLMGIPAIAEGVTLYLPNKGIHLEVAQGCSGLHSLTAMAMLAAILAYFMNLPLRWKWGLFAMALPLALIGNVVRILCVVGIANAHGQAAGMAFHDSPVGKLLPFFVAFLIVMVLGRFLEWSLEKGSQGPTGLDEPADRTEVPPSLLSEVP